jgi:hypothetical protein
MDGRRRGKSKRRLGQVYKPGNLGRSGDGIGRRQNSSKVEESEVKNRDINGGRGEDECYIALGDGGMTLEVYCKGSDMGEKIWIRDGFASGGIY